jgi:hypothetical protein
VTHAAAVVRYLRRGERVRNERSMADPTRTDPDNYSVIRERARRVLEYRDEPGADAPAQPPGQRDDHVDGVPRRLIDGDESRDVNLHAGEVRWLDAQTHAGENIGETPTHVVFVELKESPGSGHGGSALGPRM